MALFDNGLEEILLGSTSWVPVINTNFENCFTKVADSEYTADDKGPILIDRADNSKKYRLYVSSGSLNIELVS